MPAPTDSQILAANASLVAIFLVIRTRSGPRLVFHYPPRPTLTNTQPGTADVTSAPARMLKDGNRTNPDSMYSEEDTTTTTSEDDQRRGSVTTSTDHDGSTSATNTSSKNAATGYQSNNPTRRKHTAPTRTFRDEGPMDYEDDDDVSELNLNEQAALRGNISSAGRPSRRGNPMHDVQDRSLDNKKHAAWDRVLGYSAEGLEKLLSPSRDLKKKRFEVMIERLVFLGYPIFVREDGNWRKKRGAAKKCADDKEPDIDIHSTSVDSRDTKVTNQGSSSNSLDPNGAAKSYTSTGGVSDFSEARSSSASSDASSGEMTMFHVVFVMDPPPLEYHIRVGEMYDNVAKKFAKALKYEQANSGYVWREAKHIMLQRTLATDSGTPMNLLWPELMQSSRLASSIAKVFDHISQNRIARITINDDFECSLQIPPRNETPYAPTPAAPQIPGLWLTNAKMLDEDGEKGLSPHAALLLLQDKSTLLNEIESDNGELAAPLAYFVRELTPTKSLQKLANRLSLGVKDLQILARHLIYWRRARAIPPLHVRHVYVVSPYADMKTLTAASASYEAKYKELPPLARMLQSLSARPIPYGYLIPTQDHKQVYMDMLAWLLRNAWVTQLRTFAWVKVAPEIKAKVAARSRLASQESKRTAGAASHKNSGGSESGIANSAAANARRAISEEYKLATARAGSNGAMMNSVLSPLIQSGPERVHGNNGEPGPNSALNSTAVPQDPGFFTDVWPVGTLPNRTSNLHHVEKRASTPGSETVVAVDDGETPAAAAAAAAIEPLVKYESSLILAPGRATAEESQWLAAIGDGLEDREVRDAWPMLTKYFDGVWAIEEIAAREGMRRSRVWTLFGKLENEGVICVVRHW